MQTVVIMRFMSLKTRITTKQMRKIQSINIHEKFSKFDKTWTPHIIGELNEQYVKLCKLKDEFVWHSHKHEDELFMVFRGTLFMDIKDQETVEELSRHGRILQIAYSKFCPQSKSVDDLDKEGQSRQVGWRLGRTRAEGVPAHQAGNG